MGEGVARARSLNRPYDSAEPPCLCDADEDEDSQDDAGRRPAHLVSVPGGAASAAADAGAGGDGGEHAAGVQ
eukprot:1337418-Prymnesium_polylepis.1